jgi:hypothetical protein
MKKTFFLLAFAFAGLYAQAQNGSYTNLTVALGFVKSNGAAELSGWGIAADNSLDPRPNYSPGVAPYMINNHTGLTFSAHSNYGGIRFYNQGYPNTYSTANGATMAMSITNGNVGIGSTTPTAGKLQIAAPDESSVSAIAIRQGNAANYGFDFALDQNVDGRGYFYAVDNNIRTSLMEFTRGSNIVSFMGNNVGIGTTTPDQKLSVNGTIHSRKVLVDNLGWSDYVFEPDYKLPTLEEVKKYIKQNQHLPDIPSEKELEKSGIDLTEMLKLQMKKIEELTLYLIAKDEHVSKQEARIEALETALEYLKQNK